MVHHHPTGLVVPCRVQPGPRLRVTIAAGFAFAQGSSGLGFFLSLLPLGGVL